jgi:hypothetical protein
MAASRTVQLRMARPAVAAITTPRSTAAGGLASEEDRGRNVHQSGHVSLEAGEKRIG